MGGGASKQVQKGLDDAPPMAAAAHSEAARVAANLQEKANARQEKKKMKENKKQLSKTNHVPVPKP